MGSHPELIGELDFVASITSIPISHMAEYSGIPISQWFLDLVIINFCSMYQRSIKLSIIIPGEHSKVSKQTGRFPSHNYHLTINPSITSRTLLMTTKSQF